jgi:hypothetical protein
MRINMDMIILRVQLGLSTDLVAMYIEGRACVTGIAESSFRAQGLYLEACCFMFHFIGEGTQEDTECCRCSLSRAKVEKHHVKLVIP